MSLFRLEIHLEAKVTDEWFCLDRWQLNHEYITGKSKNKYELADFQSNSYRILAPILLNHENEYNTPYIDNPRGLPNNITKEVAAVYDSTNCYEPSYVTLKDLIKYRFEHWEYSICIHNFVNEIHGIIDSRDDVGNLIQTFIECDGYEDVGDNIRIVFWLR